MDFGDTKAVERAITTVTERINLGPMRTPGYHVEFAREAVGAESSTGRRHFEYSVRAGFVATREPFNHLLLQISDGSDESILTRYVNALVVAWQPDHLGLATRATQRAQGHRPQQALVGWLTYVRAGTPLDTGILDEDVSVANADHGLYITVPGTSEQPSIDHIRQVRSALGYPSP